MNVIDCLNQFVLSGRLAHRGTRWDIFRYPDVTADGRSGTNMDLADQCRVGIDRDMIAQDGMTGNAANGVPLLVRRELRTGQADSLENTHMVAYHARLANDRARAMVNGEMMTDHRTRVNVNPGLRMRHLCDHTRNERDL